MAGNTFGQIFRVTSFGESHGPAVGVIVDGCPAQLPLTTDEIQLDLDRRKPGQNALSSTRKESDEVRILSGVYQGKTTGTPIALLIENCDARSQDYEQLANIYRPGHADFSYDRKYGHRDPRGGGRSSARITAGHVAAGAIAKKILRVKNRIEIVAYVSSVSDIRANIDSDTLSLPDVESSPVRCPDPVAAEKMRARIRQTKADQDSLGGTIGCTIRNVPAGLGEPVFDKLEADLAKAMLLINAASGFEIGLGFSGSALRGSQYNDPFVVEDNQIRTQTNHCGGIQGGISNAMPIQFRVAFKPTPSIARQQETVTRGGEKTSISIQGRHDPCIVPRAVPIVEAMAALVLCDHLLRQQTASL